MRNDYHSRISSTTAINVPVKPATAAARCPPRASSRRGTARCRRSRTRSCTRGSSRCPGSCAAARCRDGRHPRARNCASQVAIWASSSSTIRGQPARRQRYPRPRIDRPREAAPSPPCRPPWPAGQAPRRPRSATSRWVSGSPRRPTRTDWRQRCPRRLQWRARQVWARDFNSRDANRGPAPRPDRLARGSEVTPACARNSPRPTSDRPRMVPA